MHFTVMKTNKIRWLAAIFLVLAAGCGGGGNDDATTPGTSRLLATSAIATTTAADYTALVQQLYISYFGRPADTAGLASFQNQLLALGAPSDIAQFSQAYHTNPAVKALVDSFGVSAESAALFSGGNIAFIASIYQNLFNRAPDDEGLAFWAGALDNGSMSRVNASLSILSGALANTSTQGKIDATLINRKVAVGSNFTVALAKAPVNGYSGDAAAAQARALLKNVSATSVTTAFDGTIATLVTSLANTLSQTMGPPIADSGRYTCSTLTHAQAVELFYQGHSYLDRDHDGKPCEVYDILAERSTATSVTVPSTGKQCYVSGYTRKNGTRVSGYYRSC